MDAGFRIKIFINKTNKSNQQKLKENSFTRQIYMQGECDGFDAVALGKY